MSAEIHVEMHNEHKLWGAEIGFWRDDIAAWQHDLAKAMGQIKELENALAKHETSLRQHAGKLRTAEERFDNHEHALCKYEAGGAGADLPAYVQKHQNESNEHAQQRKEHEELKRQHYSLIAHWRTLVKSITDAS